MVKDSRVPQMFNLDFRTQYFLVYVLINLLQETRKCPQRWKISNIPIVCANYAMLFHPCPVPHYTSPSFTLFFFIKLIF